MARILEGRVAVVTGAAQGLGRAIAEELDNAGARLALVDIDEQELQKAQAELNGRGADVATFVVDLADPAQIGSLPASVADRFGGIDILVNNAGVRSVHGYLEQPLDDWRRTLDINLTAPFLLSQGVVPYMLERGKGKIVNVASVAAELGFKNRVAYNVSKAGVAMLTKSIALELGAQGICCNAVGPGIVETSLNRQYFDDEQLRTAIISNTPAGRWGQPPEVAHPVVFLCSDGADFVNGVTLMVDGGWCTGKGY